MGIIESVSAKTISRIERTGETTLLIVTILLAGDYFKIINLNTLPIPSLSLVLWGYLLLNVTIANIIKVRRKKDNPRCPKCKRKLTELKEYECSKCGRLDFN